ncbi:hypothetical protein K7X08_021956 [Anisodus acutangulus]|uniref:Uncharacterized protein n=1 Tax=Anisodus acutangulus TaxID=402998 RepID=A0A9Q1L507_9SOLA|nr:hypothetical protein K7X08_021956 [Anisodus acutangulus]
MKILDEQCLEYEKFASTNEAFLEEICADFFRVAEFFSSMMPVLRGPTYNVREIKGLLNRFSCFATKNSNRCRVAFEGIKRESELLQSRPENYFKTRKQGPPAEIEDQPEYGYMDSDSE